MGPISLGINSYNLPKEVLDSLRDEDDLERVLQESSAAKITIDIQEVKINCIICQDSILVDDVTPCNKCKGIKFETLLLIN